MRSPSIERSVRRRVGEAVAITAAASLAIFAAGDVQKASAFVAPVPQPKNAPERAAPKDTLRQYIETNLREAHALALATVAMHRKNAYKESVILAGQKVDRIVISHKLENITRGTHSYAQFIEYLVPGQKLPFSTALILGALSPKFAVDEKMEAFTILVNKIGHPDTYLFEDYYVDSTGQPIDYYISKEGITISDWVGNSDHQTVSPTRAEQYMNGFFQAAKAMARP